MFSKPFCPDNYTYYLQVHIKGTVFSAFLAFRWKQERQKARWRGQKHLLD